MTTALTSQALLAALAEGDATALTSQAALIALAEVLPANPCSQAGLIVLGAAAPCVTRRCKLWIIERRDGTILRFTSHDRDVVWGDDTYESCASLSDSASEQSTDANSIGSIELAGIIDSEQITEADLYAGLYDDAYIEVWRKSWDDDTDVIRREAAGWAGKVSAGEQGFKAEVLGPGARLLQKPLLRSITPGCGWVFGSTECGVTPPTAAGVVTAANSRAFFTATITYPGGAAQWNQGKVTWATGANAGSVCEVRDVDGDVVFLWLATGFMPEVGDTFTLSAGCDLAFTGGCTVYANKVNFGGFPDVPGTDVISQVPDAKA